MGISGIAELCPAEFTFPSGLLLKDNSGFEVVVIIY